MRVVREYYVTPLVHDAETAQNELTRDVIPLENLRVYTRVPPNLWISGLHSAPLLLTAIIQSPIRPRDAHDRPQDYSETRGQQREPIAV